MMIWSREAFVSALALSLLHSLWQGAAFGVLGYALNARLKRATPDVRYGAFSLLLLTVFAVWLGTFGGLYWGQTRPPAPSGVFAAGTVHQNLLSTSSQSGDPAVSLLQNISPLLVALWSLGVGVLSLRHLGGFLLLRRLCRAGSMPCPPAWEDCAARLATRMGIRRQICLHCSARIDVPCAFGVFRSCILLPLSALTGLAPEQAEALIAHELAHFARHDVLLNTVQVFVETILFYHPVVRWLSAQIRVAREQRCDDLAVQVVGDRALYARALYSLEEARASIPQLALGARGDNPDMTNTHLIRRIRRVLGVSGPERRDPWAKGALALGAAAIGLATLVPVRAYPPAAPQGGKPPGAAPAGPNTTTQVTTVTRILLNINGDKIELETNDLTPDTPVKINGTTSRFGDLTPPQQQQLHQALKAVPQVNVQDLLANLPPVGQGSRTMRIFGPSTSVHSTTKIMLNINGDKIELDTTQPTPGAKVTVNGTTGRFGDLNQTQQQQIRDQLGRMKVHVRTTVGPGGLSSSVLSAVEDALRGTDLPESVKLHVLEGVKAQTAPEPPVQP